MNNLLLNKIQRHPYHLVTNSPWPFLSSIFLFVMLLGLLFIFRDTSILGFIYFSSFNLFFFGFLGIILTASIWWRDIIREALLEGFHTFKVQKGLKLGFILFIISEIMLFVSFFWAFFHASLSPNIEIGCIWPPYGINVLHTWYVPFLNTLILLFSGATITWAHQLLLIGNYEQTSIALGTTICLALFFTGLQICEYFDANFDISDGIYGSVFFMLTGLHGFHVIVGTFFISICLIRHFFKQFTRTHHLGFEAAIWYWHFVDVVWLFLFIFVYWWGNK